MAAAAISASMATVDVTMTCWQTATAVGVARMVLILMGTGLFFVSLTRIVPTDNVAASLKQKSNMTIVYSIHR